MKVDELQEVVSHLKKALGDKESEVKELQGQLQQVEPSENQWKNR